MAIIKRKKKDGISFQVKVRDRQNNWYPARHFDSLPLAKEEEARLFALNRKGVEALSQDAKTVTLHEYWDVWSIENRSDVSAGWKISQDQMYRDYIKPVLGDLLIRDIRTPEIGRALNRARTGGLGEQTCKHIYSLLRKMFNDAIEYYEMISANPVKARFHRPVISQKKRSFLSPKDAWTLLEFVKDHYLGPAIYIQTLAGLRPSEVQALKGHALDFDRGQILICSAYNNKTKQLQPYPKQEDWAYSPMPPQLKTYLLKRKLGPDDFVCPGPDGKKMLSYNTYLGALRPLCVNAGVKALTPHELRHTCTEIYIHAGASAEDIRRLLNHASLTATKHYIHRTDERLNSIAGNLGKDMFPKMFPNGNKETFSSEVKGE